MKKEGKSRETSKREFLRDNLIADRAEIAAERSKEVRVTKPTVVSGVYGVFLRLDPIYNRADPTIQCNFC